MLYWLPRDTGCVHRYKHIAYDYEIAVLLSILLIKMMINNLYIKRMHWILWRGM